MCSKLKSIRLSILSLFRLIKWRRTTRGEGAAQVKILHLLLRSEKKTQRSRQLKSTVYRELCLRDYLGQIGKQLLKKGTLKDCIDHLKIMEENFIQEAVKVD